jgi:hypothetical protein
MHGSMAANERTKSRVLIERSINDPAFCCRGRDARNGSPAALMANWVASPRAISPWEVDLDFKPMNSYESDLMSLDPDDPQYISRRYDIPG